MNRQRRFGFSFGIYLALMVILMPGTLVQASLHPNMVGRIVQDNPPITMYMKLQKPEARTLDPQMASDAQSLEVIEQLFLGLTNVDPVTTDFVPELAIHWAVSDDGRVWTFTLRDDVPWVTWDSATQTAVMLRMVTAHDVAYGMQRACDPRLESLYTPVAAQIIQGCDRLASLDPAEVVEDDYELVQVRALDDTTLVVQLQYAAGYFLSMTALPMFRPVPREIIAQEGVAWTLPDVIVTNGPFLLDRWVRGEGRIFVRNSLLPLDLLGPGNAERVVVSLVVGNVEEYFYMPDYDAAYSFAEDQVEPWLADERYSGQLTEKFQLIVWHVGFRYARPPFDNVHVRRAFSASMDRAHVLQHYVPMIHFTPPGIFGAPAIDEVGVGYDPLYAREQLALGGYPDCVGLPPVTITTFVENQNLVSALWFSMQDTLGCDAELLTIELLDPAEVVIWDANYDFFFDGDPHMWILGWKPDYPDAHNWVGDFIGCEGLNMFQRPCSAVDDLIWQAAVETDLANRAALYRDIEERLFGIDGEYPMIPLGMEVEYVIHKPWLDGPFMTDGLFGGIHYDWYTVDQEAQRVARGG